ncbi:hypothetical protein AOB60_01030 [Streptomyces noursei]|uniref:Cysteine dioxygenase n=2 Tax=Streptomyces noursei TaxID=1971 RepID=A0A2N8PRA0_STRNR|nr:hypothetical protein AOB60_01030 [Streptomyces noursei]
MPTVDWLASAGPLHSTDLHVARRAAGHLLGRLSQDPELLTRLVYEIEDDPRRLAASRTTLLLDRLSLYEAPGARFEVRLNLNPRTDNQLVPHDHCYTFASRILRGGYVHRVWRRTDDGNGDFTSADLQPGVVTIERPGSSYVLGHQAVHQAFMRPGTVSLFVRGPRLKPRSHAAQHLMPGISSWPEPPSPGLKPVPSRSATYEEYIAMRDYLLQHGVIG